MKKVKARVGWKSVIKRKMTKSDGHYKGGLVAGATVLEMFGDAATELCVRESGFEGLFRAYQSVDFLAPVYVGDVVTVTATITKVGKTSRQMTFVATKSHPKKVMISKAEGTVVIPELRSGV
ncbi:MAG: 3-aminobutyryl-CoA ammonia lyase [Deltaproteobacteria bacterium]|nr:MAG: 3-aminobutyryl-CoA ammonia lyase [Deltaproteobacteria bacterium]